MVNPTLNKKTESALTVNKNTKKLFQVVYNEQNKSEENQGEQKIKVSSLISKMAFYYEKIRNSVDYKEEHLLRKNAILRILNRQIVIEGSVPFNDQTAENISRHLLLELIRAGYLPNDKMPEKLIGELGKIIARYMRLRKEAQARARMGEKKELSDFILTMAACEIEELLGRNKIDQAVVSNIFDILNTLLEAGTDSPYKKDKEIQIYLGIHASYLKYDRELLTFVLFKYFNEGWQEADEEKVARVAQGLPALRRAIRYQLDHPLARQINKFISRYTVFFSVYTDVIKEDPVNVYGYFKNDPKAFSRDIKKVCVKKYAVAQKRLWRAAIRSIVYIFVTKSVFAIILEVPAAKWFGEEINPISLAINITFPAALLFLAILFTKLPGDENTAKIVEGINEITFEEKEKKTPTRLRGVSGRSSVLNFIFSLVYIGAFAASLFFVVWGLQQIGFNWVSIIIFLFFLAFVSFFAIRIRKGAKELIVLDPKENIFSFFSDFFYVPIIIAGKWLSEKFARLNVFVFVMDFIIEAPFKIFIEIAEEWTKYVKEKKDEII